MGLEFRQVTKQFVSQASVDPLTAVRDITFKVEEGEFVSVVGPSGCGKSTILSMTAGLYAPTEGEVLVSGEPVRGPNSHVGFMLQKDLLLPWRTIIKNVEFGLESRGVARATRRERALSELARCQLDGFDNHYPYQLSGGMRQRAALARTLAIDPDIILLDEPFSALDAQTKLLLQNSFAETIAQAKITTLLITHDLSEAVLMSDRVIVLSERPGTILETIDVELPDRAHPLARRQMPQVYEYAARIFDLLKLDERAA
ncbi:MAG: ABC transporter ATP-binding protein [Rhodobacteraceae bacterium]|nr:ABC transporter ATP-binding protein [Paracoccaceae bacterium]